MPFFDLTFPVNGLDLARGFGQQRPGSTPTGVNVRACDPQTFRFRGAARPGLVKFVPTTIPPGATLIQHLNTVVHTDVDALTGSPDWPDDYVEDPSSPGPESSWPTGTINDDSGFDPVTGLSERSRNPGGPGSSRKVFPRRVRNGGNARPPSKNAKRPRRPDTLDPALLDITPRFKFIGFAEYSYSYNLTGTTQNTSATFTGATCYPYRPAVGIGPPPSLTPSGLATLDAAKQAYFARIAYQNPTGISLVREWWASSDSNGLPLPSGICSCADVHEFGGYDGNPGNDVACP